MQVSSELQPNVCGHFYLKTSILRQLTTYCILIQVISGHFKVNLTGLLVLSSTHLHFWCWLELQIININIFCPKKMNE